jgi:hypothetical protein
MDWAEVAVQGTICVGSAVMPNTNCLLDGLLDAELLDDEQPARARDVATNNAPAARSGVRR